MAHVALRRLRVGDAMLEPGDEVPIEDGRNTNLMLRQGLIADLGERARSEEDWASQAEAYQSRISLLEGQLADAQDEIASLRTGTDASALETAERERDEAKAELEAHKADAGEQDGGEPEEGGEVPLELVDPEQHKRDTLVEMAEEHGLQVPSSAAKAEIAEAINTFRTELASQDEPDADAAGGDGEPEDEGKGQE